MGPTLDPERFTIADVLVDAWATFRRTFTAHARWNLEFAAIAVLSSFAMGCILMAAAASLGPVARRGAGSIVGVGVVLGIYLLFLLAAVALFALHQGVTLAIAEADARGEPVGVWSALAVARARLPAMTGAMLARLGLDLAVGGVVVGAAMVGTVGSLGDAGPEERIPRAMAALGWLAAAYLVGLAWGIVVRGYVGLSGPCAHSEGLGPLAAIARSARLLAGRRLQMIGLRVVWALIAGVLYVVTYAPMLLLVGAAPSGGIGGLVVLLAIAYAFAWYAFVLHVVSFDTVLEGAFFARVVRQRSTEEIARVFA